jgi:hypothetical protein
MMQYAPVEDVEHQDVAATVDCHATELPQFTAEITWGRRDAEVLVELPDAILDPRATIPIRHESNARAVNRVVRAVTMLADARGGDHRCDERSNSSAVVPRTWQVTPSS